MRNHDDCGGIIRESHLGATACLDCHRVWLNDGDCEYDVVPRDSFFAARVRLSAALRWVVSVFANLPLIKQGLAWLQREV